MTKMSTLDIDYYILMSQISGTLDCLQSEM